MAIVCQKTLSYIYDVNMNKVYSLSSSIFMVGLKTRLNNFGHEFETSWCNKKLLWICIFLDYFMCLVWWAFSFTSLHHIANNVFSMFLCNEFPWFLYWTSPNLCLLVKVRLVSWTLSPCSHLVRWEALWLINY